MANFNAIYKRRGRYLANKKQQRPKLQIIPLGGVDEIGKNMTAFVYGDDMILVDCGSMFPQEEMLGIDLVIPDITFLVKNRDKLRAILITHGHEDHIGAMPYVLRELPVPVYGTQLSLGLIENKLKEHRVNNAKLNTIAAGDKISIGCFTIEFIKVCHSIAGAVALAIHTPVGTVVHTGDFKIDYTPIDGVPTDLAKFALLGKQGVLCLLGESTNVERPGSTISERKICLLYTSSNGHVRDLPKSQTGVDIENKLKEHRVNNAKLNTIAAGDKISIGCFTIEFIKAVSYTHLDVYKRQRGDRGKA